MLTEEEEAFVEYWKANRDRQKKTFRQFLLGMPVALLFVIAIGINFFSGWYKRADMVTRTNQFNPGVLLLALLLILAFVAIFSRKMRWEQQEQRYLELLEKKKRSESPEKK
jgi:hypothetical protein